MFRGVNPINMDSKHRIAMPTKYREAILQQSAGRLVVNIDINQPKCLAIYPANVWEDIEERIQGRLRNAGQGARMLRLLLGNACDVDMDANGRLLLPTLLREHAKLEKKVVLVGLVKKLELWREDDWAAEQSDGYKDIQDPELVAKIIDDIGFI